MTEDELLSKLAALLTDYEDEHDVIIGCEVDLSDNKNIDINDNFIWNGDRFVRKAGNHEL